jgi:hypothetical protein
MKKLAWTLSLLVLVAAPRATRAHCDTLDGPVVNAARAALENGKLAPVLAWVQPADEAEIRAAFASARAVRKGGKDSRELADRWFFETLVRVHRAGEGAPYTGLKPAGALDPAVAATDRAIAGGDYAALEKLLVDAVRGGLHANVARFQKERPPADDVAAGRRWVAAYVPFVHWAEAVHAAASAGGEPHGASGHAGHGAGAADGAAGTGHAQHAEREAAAPPKDGEPGHHH